MQASLKKNILHEDWTSSPRRDSDSASDSSSSSLRSRRSTGFSKMRQSKRKFSTQYRKHPVNKFKHFKNKRLKLNKASINQFDQHQNNKENNSESCNFTSKKNVNSNNKVSVPEKCTIGLQYNMSLQSHPQDAVEELIALTNENLVISSGDDGDKMARPQTKITDFTILDQHGHLCPIEVGVDKREVQIYMSGYLKSIRSNSDDIDMESVPVKECGPILQWYIRGFNRGVNNRVTLSTEFGEYNLLKPSAEYKPLMDSLYEKIWLTKVIVEYIKKAKYLQPTYKDLLEAIKGVTIPDLNDKKITEEMLHKHAQFIYDQVTSLDAHNEPMNITTLPCMRELMKLIENNFGKREFYPQFDYKTLAKSAFSKATTTPVVQKTFASFFSNQLDKTNHERKSRCGVCEDCQVPDCGECRACRAMCKFGGHGRYKQACVRRRCCTVDEQESDKSESDDSSGVDEAASAKMVVEDFKKIKWIGQPIKVDATKVYYKSVEIDGAEFTLGDFVMLENEESNIPAMVSRVVYMWKDTNTKIGYFHGEIMLRASDTVLGEVGYAREVFLGDRCYHGVPLSSILRKASVERQDPPKDWFKIGGKQVIQDILGDDGKTYFYQKYYNKSTARFEDLPGDSECPNVLRKHRFCPSCERKMICDNMEIPKVYGEITNKSELVRESYKTEWMGVRWLGNEYKKGCGVFLWPGTFSFQTVASQNSRKRKMRVNVRQSTFKFKFSHSKKTSTRKIKLKKVDEDMYPEYYRKRDNLYGSNIGTRKPFSLGLVAAVAATGYGPLISPRRISLHVHVLYRPEHTTSEFPQNEDLNLVYWSDEIREIPFFAVAGLCDLVYVDNIPHQDIHEWLGMDPTRIYFRQCFDSATGKFGDVPYHAKQIGRGYIVNDSGKGKGKGKGQSTKSSETNVAKTQEINQRPLRTLDVFAGCGGLSEGLHRSRVAECKWAVENWEAAAHAYSLNNENCRVFNEDCNMLLKDVISGATHSAAGLRLPVRGEVELLCGGPPCQGFSGMNRFNLREYSNFKNSLVVTFLSFCDFYRPKYVIFENVRNFVAFKKGMVLKLSMRALLDMGYQCTFGVLQAGHYGVAQTRRRLFILAAAPGRRLPAFPEPTHGFSRRAGSLTTIVDGKRFSTNIRWNTNAPRRTYTVRDAISDLPEICNGASKTEIEYGFRPTTHFQRLVRSRDKSAKLRDHICKNMAPLAQARIERIPKLNGSDWRDLPNISLSLSDGTKCQVLRYRFDDKKKGRSRNGALRGVCACVSGGPCSPPDRQENTLIPWFLPHTANRQNNWAGLYGRLSWDGYFSTTVTDPEPMGKQGRVLHPTQHRIVSVRECARSQGFHDTFLFAGTIQDKYRQIGNAVPPPLAAALGREIKKAMSASKDNHV